MKFKENLNYTILTDNVDKEFLNTFQGYQIIDYDITYNNLVKKLEYFPSKQVVFNNTLYNLNKEELDSIFDLLNKQKVSYINITSNIEEAIFSDYIYVLNNKDLILEGSKEIVLKEEKALKKLGYGLPFAVDLSIQLGIYEVLDKIYYQEKDLAEALWN